MSTMIPDLVVGSVGFGSNFADNTASLESQIRELIKSNDWALRQAQQRSRQRGVRRH
jgi:hypothetical protein